MIFAIFNMEIIFFDPVLLYFLYNFWKMKYNKLNCGQIQIQNQQQKFQNKVYKLESSLFFVNFEWIFVNCVEMKEIFYQLLVSKIWWHK